MPLSDFHFCVENWLVDSTETIKVQCDLGARNKIELRAKRVTHKSNEKSVV